MDDEVAHMEARGVSLPAPSPQRREKPRQSSRGMSTGRRPTNTNRTAVAVAPEPIYVPDDGQAAIEDSKNGSSSGPDVSRDWSDSEDGSNSQRHDGPAAAVRQRHRTPKTRVPEQPATKDNYSRSSEKAASQNQEASLFSLLANDVTTLAWATLRLPGTFYPLWRWILLIYIGWMTFAYLLSYAYRSATAAIAPLCTIPIVGSQLPFCTVHPGENPIDVSKVATSQEGFTVVMDRVGQNFDLARDMVGHEFAVRDLRIRVAASNLSRKKELTRELESLIRYTKQTAK